MADALSGLAPADLAADDRTGSAAASAEAVSRYRPPHGSQPAEYRRRLAGGRAPLVEHIAALIDSIDPGEA